MNTNKGRSVGEKYKQKRSKGSYDSQKTKSSMSIHEDSNLSDEGEIEFEGWVEFVTKPEENENEGYSNAMKKKKKKNYFTNQIGETENNVNYNGHHNKMNKYNRKTNNSRNMLNTDNNHTNSTYSSNSDKIYQTHRAPVNDNIVYSKNNSAYKKKAVSNTDNIINSQINVLEPNYVDPASPVLLKNEQVLPQLYIRQPPTVVVTNESRPPLVINPPPANVILKNKAPQPIYVNSSRPNIIIKNDPPVIQNPINMDTTPIQLDVPMIQNTINDNSVSSTANSNHSTTTIPINTLNNAVQYPNSITINNDFLANNDNSCYYQKKLQVGNNTMPLNIIQADNNNVSDMFMQNNPNVIIIDGQTQNANLFQQQKALPLVLPLNNVIHPQGSMNNPITTFDNQGYSFIQQNHNPNPYAHFNSTSDTNAHIIHQPIIADQTMINPPINIMQSPPTQVIQQSGAHIIQQPGTHILQHQPGTHVMQHPGTHIMQPGTHVIQQHPMTQVIQQGVGTHMLQQPMAQVIQQGMGTHMLQHPMAEAIQVTPSYDMYNTVQPPIIYDGTYMSPQFSQTPVFVQGATQVNSYPNNVSEPNLIHTQLLNNIIPQTNNAAVMSAIPMLDSTTPYMNTYIDNNYNNMLPPNVQVCNKPMVQQHFTNPSEYIACGKSISCNEAPNTHRPSSPLKKCMYSNGDKSISKIKKVQIFARPMYNANAKNCNLNM